jgi:Transglutaminase-like superfamily
MNKLRQSFAKPRAWLVVVLIVALAPLVAMVAPKKSAHKAQDFGGRASPSPSEPLQPNTMRNVTDLPEWLVRGEDYVRSEAYYALAQKEIFLALAAVRYVTNRLSPLRHGYIAQKFGPQYLPKTAAVCLEMEAGICGSQVDAGLQLIRQLGIKARSVQFYWGNAKGRQSHIALEVFVRGRWRFIDATWSAWFEWPGSEILDLASLSEISADSAVKLKLHFDPASPAYLVSRIDGDDPFDYLKPYPDMVRVSGMNGIVPLLVVGKDAWTSAGLPNFFGRTTDHGIPADSGIQIVLPKVAAGISSLRIEKPALGCVTGTIMVTTSGGVVLTTLELPAQAIPGSAITLAFAALPKADAVTLKIQTPADTVCYVVFDQITASK